MMRNRWAIIVVAALTVTACTNDMRVMGRNINPFAEEKILDTGLVGDNLVKPETLPIGTIQTGPDLYMIPLPQEDPDGCQPYRAYSPNRLVTHTLFYRGMDGSFVKRKSKSECYVR